MIRHGRTAIDRKGVAVMCPEAATPWRLAGHPPPINLDPLSTDIALRTFLYDLDQVAAFAARQPIPDLPDLDHPDDLLTERDSAAHLGITLADFRDRLKSLRIPRPDQPVLGVNHWRRHTIDAHAHSPGRGVGSGPPRQGNAARRRMAAVVATRPANHTIGPTELARGAGVTLRTARAYLRAPALQVTATFTQPIGPDLAVWRAFVDDVQRLATGPTYAEIAIRITEK